MLDYALIEDRLNEFLKNLGIANETDCGLTVTKRTKNEIRELLHLNEKSHFGINKISVKLDIIRNLVEYDGNSDYLADSHSILIKKIDKESLCSLIKSIEGWKDKRNGFVHGLLNRVPAECDDTIRELASEGKPLFRELDKYCRRIENVVSDQNIEFNPIALNDVIQNKKGVVIMASQRRAHNELLALLLCKLSVFIIL